MRKPSQTRNRLLSLKEKTGWSWERMCRECHRVMDSEGPSHTTLFRYAEGKVNNPNKTTEQWILVAITRLGREGQ